MKYAVVDTENYNGVADTLEMAYENYVGDGGQLPINEAFFYELTPIHVELVVKKVPTKKGS